MSKTSRSSFAKPACCFMPNAAEPFNVLRLVLGTQPRSNLVAFGDSVGIPIFQKSKPERFS